MTDCAKRQSALALEETEGGPRRQNLDPQRVGGHAGGVDGGGKGTSGLFSRRSWAAVGVGGMSVSTRAVDQMAACSRLFTPSLPLCGERAVPCHLSLGSAERLDVSQWVGK